MKSKNSIEEKKIVFFTSLAITLILLGLIVFYFVDSFLILGIFCSLGIMCLAYAFFVDFYYIKKYNKELDKELNNFKK